MKRISGTASAVAPASAERCIALLAAVEGYPAWHPEVVRAVEVLDRDEQGRATRVRAKLRVSRGPFKGDFEFTLAVGLEPPGTVELKRLPNEAGDQEEFAAVWSVEEGSQTRIELALDAHLDVPRLVPLRGLGEALAEGFVAALSRELAA